MLRDWQDAASGEAVAVETAEASAATRTILRSK